MPPSTTSTIPMSCEELIPLDTWSHILTFADPPCVARLAACCKTLEPLSRDMAMLRYVVLTAMQGPGLLERMPYDTMSPELWKGFLKSNYVFYKLWKSKEISECKELLLSGEGEASRYRQWQVNLEPAIFVCVSIELLSECILLPMTVE